MWFSVIAGSALMNLALLVERGAHAVMRAHQMRQLDYRQGKGLGSYDRIVTWIRPTAPGSGWSRDDWDALPKQLRLRIVRIKVEIQFRVHQYDLVTTLTDADIYTKDNLQNSTSGAGRGAVLSPNQDDYGNGKAALPNSRNGSQRTADALDRLQLNPRSNAGSCRTSTRND